MSELGWGSTAGNRFLFCLFVSWVCSTALALRGLSSCWNSCKSLKDVCFPAGKCSPHCNLELFAAECFLYACVFLGSCIITCVSYSQVLLDATWDGDIRRYVYMYDTGLFVFLSPFLQRYKTHAGDKWCSDHEFCGFEYRKGFKTASVTMTLMGTLWLEEAGSCQASVDTLVPPSTIGSGLKRYQIFRDLVV